jgi:hypothetical protein
MSGKVILAAVGVLLAVTLSACGRERADQPPTAPQSNQQIQAMAANMLAAYNSGDYGAFSRDLSLPARLIVDEHAFADFRTENLPVTGPYMTVTSVQREPGREDPDHGRYLVQARFQHQDAVVLVMTISRSGEIDGLELYPRTEG